MKKILVVVLLLMIILVGCQKENKAQITDIELGTSIDIAKEVFGDGFSEWVATDNKKPNNEQDRMYKLEKEIKVNGFTITKVSIDTDYKGIITDIYIEGTEGKNKDPDVFYKLASDWRDKLVERHGEYELIQWGKREKKDFAWEDFGMNAEYVKRPIDATGDNYYVIQLYKITRK